MKRLGCLRSFTRHQITEHNLPCPYRFRCKYQPLHTTAKHSAVPLPHLAAPGPPPSPPVQEAASVNNPLSRRKRGVDQLIKRNNVKGGIGKNSGILQNRFWKGVNIREGEDGYQIHLDKRPVRIDGKKILVIPTSKPQLAFATALEWDLLTTAAQALKQHYIPLTSLISRVHDISVSDQTHGKAIRKEIVKVAMRYLATDSLLCWDPPTNAMENNKLSEGDDQGEGLREIQKRLAQPIIKFLTANVWPGAELRPILGPDSILPLSQPAETSQIIEQWLMQLLPFELAGLERAFLASKSLIIATRLVVQWSEAFKGLWEFCSTEEAFDIDQAVVASSSETKWQTDRWGEVEDSHDVNGEDLRRQLGSVVVLVSGSDA